MRKPLGVNLRRHRGLGGGNDVPGEDFVGEVQPLIRALKADGDPGHMEAGRFATTVLEGLWRNDHRTVSSVYATARTMVWPWIDPLVARSTASCTINLDWLLEKYNTLYVPYGTQKAVPALAADAAGSASR